MSCVWCAYMAVCIWGIKGNERQENVSMFFLVSPHSTQKPCNSGISPPSKYQSVLQ